MTSKHFFISLLCALSGIASSHADVELLNVSYDPTREFYKDYNVAFAAHWKEKSNEVVTVKQSHGGSGKQARSVIDGLKADVVTLALASDIDALAEHDSLVSSDWQSKLPHNSSPYWSTIVFLVRKGNPKGIKNWDDLVKGDIQIITPNPKTSGGARWNYLAAWAHALLEKAGSAEALKDPKVAQAAEAHARDFISQIYKRVPVLDSGARGSTTTFVERGIGDVLLTWENEAFLAIKELGHDKVEIVVPSLSIRAEPPVAVVEKVAAAQGTTTVATEYLKFLYSPVGQKLAATHYYRPVSPEFADAGDMARFPTLSLVTIDELFGGWKATQAKHFADQGIFDQLYESAKP